MTDGTAKWLSGCGIGCLILLVVLIVGGVGVYRLAKGTIEEFEGVEEAISELMAAHGEVREFTPHWSGEIPAARVEAFLATRDATRPIRDEVRRSVGDLESGIEGFRTGETGGFWEILSTFRRGFAAIPQLARFHQIRAEALLDQEMGLGEYEYIYVLAFYSWLGESPGDGPAFLRIGDNNDVSWNPDHHPEEAEEQRRAQVVRRVRSNFRAAFRNALAAAGSGDSRVDPEWLAAVEREMAELEARRDRLPWQDGLPSAMENSLRPYRERLEDSYDALNNALEMIPLARP